MFTNGQTQICNKELQLKTNTVYEVKTQWFSDKTKRLGQTVTNKAILTVFKFMKRYIAPYFPEESKTSYR